MSGQRFTMKHHLAVPDRRRTRRFACVLVGLLALISMVGGCTMVGPDYVKPSAPEPQEWIQSADSKIESKETDYSNWWTGFNDPTLNALIQSAYEQNLSLKVTGIRILEARAQLGIAVGNQYPQTQRGKAEAGARRTSQNLVNEKPNERFSYVADMGLEAAWELDFWGKFRRAVQTGVAELEASIANYDDNLVFLTSEVARVYIQLRTSEERLVVAHENAEIERKSLRLAEDRFREGAVTKLDQLQSRALLRTTEASIPKFESDIRQAKNALAILLGKLPGEIDAMLGPQGNIPKIPSEAAVGVPAELLRRRPDIRLAERRLAAQSALIGVAKADLFPHFSLFGSIGYASSASTSPPESRNAGFSEMFKGRSLAYSAGPSISWDLFNYGRINNRIRVQDARFQQLAVDYENTVLEAVQEVEDAMIGFLRTQDQVAFLADAVAAYKESVDLSSLQYMEGEADFQRVLDAMENLVETQDSWITASGQVGVFLVFLYKALGGGWEMRAGKDFVPSEIKAEMNERTNWGDLLAPDKLEVPPSEEVNRLFNRPDW